MARAHWLKGLLFSLLVIAAITAAAAWATDAFGARAERGGTEILETAVERAAAACYAIEGRYPRTLGYLEEHYGLAYDRARYVVFYDVFASNVMPEVRVSLRGER